MANPTFNGVQLCTQARETIGCPQVRSYMEMLPGANGAYVQPHGTGPRQIVVEGVLSADGASVSGAVDALKTGLRAIQSDADGQTVAAYSGADGNNYAHCMLMSYEASGKPWFKGLTAYYFVRAVLVELDP